MGQFSWLYADNKKQMIDNKKADSYLLVPPAFQEFYGKYIKESCYDGYGNMGGYDVYELVAEWNKEYIPDVVNAIKAGVWENAAFAEMYVDDMLRYYKGKNHIRCELRDIGIAIACYDEDNERLLYPIKITSKPMEYDTASPSKSDPNQGWEIAAEYESDEFDRSLPGISETRARALLYDIVNDLIFTKGEAAVAKYLYDIGFTEEELTESFGFKKDILEEYDR